MAGISEKIYQLSPIWAQQLQVAAYGWWWHRRRFGRDFHRLVGELKSREKWTASQFHDYQSNQLSELLHAAARSEYYSQAFAQAGISIAGDPFEVLARLPILSKETLRRHARKLLTQKNIPQGTIVFKSSGTTGTPTEIFYTPEFHALELAVLEARNLGWAGVTYGQRRVMFGVRKVCNFDQAKPPFWRFSSSENLAYASIYHLSPRFLPDYMEFLRRFRPTIVMGYPSALNTLASYALDRCDMPGPAKAIVTTSETVTDNARTRIEKAFQCKIYDGYCAVEMCHFASQCEFGRYHISPEVGIIEILDSDDKPVRPGVTGQVICTGLQNNLQPLIRYRVGDVARWATDQTCQCERAMPILEAIEGRFEDICVTPDGREMLRFDTVFKGVENIREAQVVQESIDVFTIYVVPGDGFGLQDVQRLKTNMELHVGVTITTNVRCVEAIARSRSGKFKAVVCNLSSETKASIRSMEHRLPIRNP